MRRIWICLILLFTFYGSSYKINFKGSLDEFKSKKNNLLFDLSLKKVKKLKDNSFIEHEKKKEEIFQISNFQKENKYDKEIDSLENKDEEKLYLLKNISFVNLKNSGFITKPSCFVHIKKNSPYLSKINNIKEDKINEALNDVTNSFIQVEGLLSNDTKLLEEYKNLMDIISNGLDKAKVYFVTALSYIDIGSVFITNEDSQTFHSFTHKTKKYIQDFYKCSLDSYNFHSDTKEEMNKRLLNLLLLEDLKKEELFERKILDFKSKIKESLKSAKIYEENCLNKMRSSFNNLQDNLANKYCWGFTCNKRSCYNPCCNRSCCYVLNCLHRQMASSYVTRAKNKMNKNLDSDFILEINNLLNSFKLKEIGKGNFYGKKVKKYLDLLVEKIIDIKNDFVKQSKFAYTSFDKLVKLHNNSLKMSFSHHSIARELASLPIEFKRTFHYIDWNELLREKFNHYKREFYILFYGL
ncbi:reticulocyte binding protein, putative [Plasmodium relictum]|uniref:Reticulocyte binding protein, putative n=1 Tax=Plasmodium relictum TaxID=85471 RepID=A0A1J1GKD2_PLARL|nr:reticulocyte binding protein, putative [Plasmodium relictum]CRG85031.1 reticulocyte binding protein, putative [Plasmodium relictum]